VRAVQAFVDAPDGLGEPVLTHRLEDVVDGVQLERADREVLVRRHEDDLWAVGAPGQGPGDVHTGRAGHPDVKEQGVDALLGGEQPDRLGA